MKKNSINESPARRGNELRQHILKVAMSVFLETGFERASMDVISSRAQTSKRTLYAHFESKEKLYLAIIELLGEIYQSKLKNPRDYSDDPIEAIVLFCGRYLEGILYVWTIRMCRMSIAEAERFPEGSHRYFDILIAAPTELLSAYLKDQFRLSDSASSDAAQKLIGRIIYPRFQRTLFGLDTPVEELNDTLAANFDLAPVRDAVTRFLESAELHVS